jgi:hypothetical protein
MRPNSSFRPTCGSGRPRVKPSLVARRRFAVVLGFVVFVAVVLVAVYLIGLGPTQAQACQRQCAASGKTGELVYKGPASPKRNPLYDIFSECECR